MTQGGGGPRGGASATVGAGVGVGVAASPAERQLTGAYCAREEHLIEMEKAGQISFHYVINDGQPQNMIWLVGLKNIFSKQLPNMPREYIVRLVLDRNHRSVALIKAPNTVVGGITYRVFPSTGLGEIAFCAVTAQEQVKGFGTRLMNYAKEFARAKDKLAFFLTYADNAAVGYFSKQGFTKAITVDKDRWQGYIKDYDGGTLMECILHPKICYTELPNLIRAQLTELDKQIRGLSNSHVVYPGLQHFRSSSRRSQLAIENIPGVLEAGWTPEMNQQAKYKLIIKDVQLEPTPENLQKLMVMLLKEMKRNQDSWPFLAPVSPEDVPDYRDVIRDPIDLSMIEKRLSSQSYYLTLDIFVADFKRMYENCKIYNAPDTIYYKLAVKGSNYLDQYLQAHVVFEKP